MSAAMRPRFRSSNTSVRERVLRVAMMTTTAVASISVGNGGAWAAAANSAAPTATIAATPVTPPVAAAPVALGVYTPPKVTVVAAAKAKKTPVYASAAATKPFFTFDNKTNFSGRHVFVVLATEGTSYRVLLPMRPNGKTGYVRASDVQLYQHDYAVLVKLSEKTLTVYKAGAPIMQEKVGIGTAKHPTPTGSYFMRELARPRNPGGAYGPWAFGLSAYSNVLQRFGRGDGQIGIHGTNKPNLLGSAVSHGCVRMRNSAITKLAKTLPQGVPVEIVA